MGQDLATRLKTKVETLIARSEALDRDNAELKARLARCETENEKKAELTKSGDRMQARRKVARLIKEIDACVSLLGE